MNLLLLLVMLDLFFLLLHLLLLQKLVVQTFQLENLLQLIVFLVLMNPHRNLLLLHQNIDNDYLNPFLYLHYFLLDTNFLIDIL
ncbi:MAG: hypothetical protein EBZ69_01360 [Alphaproteobacteria bacterium]|nr:hypothetical protein [Alphaproteobacteria bacterium]